MGSRRRRTNTPTTRDAGLDARAGSQGFSNQRLPLGGRDQVPVNRERRRKLVFERLGSRRVLAVITGTVFHDLDGSMRQDSTEIRLENRLAYIDANENAQLDPGEFTSLSNSDGQFQFDAADDGIYPVRLFTGSDRHQQTFPVLSSHDILSAELENVIAARLVGDSLQVLTSDSIVDVAINGTRSTTTDLDFIADDIIAAISGERDGGGASLIHGRRTSDSGSASDYSASDYSASDSASGLWLIVSGNATSLLGDQANVVDAAVGMDGHGLALVSSNSPSVDGDPAENGIPDVEMASVQTLTLGYGYFGESGYGFHAEVNPTAYSVPADAQVLASSKTWDASFQGAASGEESMSSRSIVAWPISVTTSNDNDETSETPALKTTLWDNASGSPIEGTETVLVGATELLGFDDESGLLAVRYQQGTVGLLDVESSFAPLHDLSSAAALAVLVDGQEAMASVESTENGVDFTLTDLRTGGELVRQSMPLSSIGDPVEIVPRATFGEFYLVGSRGIADIRWDQSAAYVLETRGGQATQDAIFGVNELGGNEPPVASGSLDLETEEDSGLQIEASLISTLVSDLDRDELATVIAREPANGGATIDAGGAVSYTPRNDFFGTDTFAIAFHDGVTMSAEVLVSITVTPTPDVPRGVSFAGGAIPEHTVGPIPVGAISFHDADGIEDYLLTLSDPRFHIEQGDLILVSGGLDYETEPQVYLSVSGYDAGAEAFFDYQLTIPVGDENDPVLDLMPEYANVYENDRGAHITELFASDQDVNQSITFTVDDDRFETVGAILRLKSDQSLDYEAEPLVVLNVTASDGAGSDATAELRVTVFDVPEAISSITLSNRTVMELESGAVVGQVLVDGQPIGESIRATVDDDRFEIADSQLKLLNDRWVERAAAEQIQVTITAQDEHGEFAFVSADFVIDVIKNESPFHNDSNPYDVDVSGDVTPMDALTIINYLNIYGMGPVGPGDPAFGYDVNGDGTVSALDALLVINYLNSLQNGGETVGGEGSQPGSEENVTAELEDAEDLIGPRASSNGEGEQVGNVGQDPISQRMFGAHSRNRFYGPLPFEASQFEGGDRLADAGLIGPINDAPITARSFQRAPVSNASGLTIAQSLYDIQWLNGVRESSDRDLQLAIDELILLLQLS